MARFIISAFSDEASKDIVEQIAACKANGVTHMELRGVNGKNISEFSTDEAKELKKLLDDNGMFVSSIGSYYGKIPIDDEFDEHFENFKNTVKVAKILEAEYIRIFSFFFTEDEDFDEYKQEVFDRIEKMADYADDNGILCCHENEKDIYGDIPERCLELLQRFEGKLGGILTLPTSFSAERYPGRLRDARTVH
jgi:sugar phosphate isomerase/epimerase